MVPLLWTVTESVEAAQVAPLPQERRVREGALQDALEDTCGALAFPGARWALALSGGRDSRSILRSPSATNLPLDWEYLAFAHYDGLPAAIAADFPPQRRPQSFLRRDGERLSDWRDRIHLRACPFEGQIYNVGAGNEVANREITARILAATGRDESLIRPVPDRLGHDRRYSVDCSELRALGWAPQVPFEDGLAATVAWYAERRDWWQPIKSGEWRAYHEAQYGTELRAEHGAQYGAQHGAEHGAEHGALAD